MVIDVGIVRGRLYSPTLLGSDSGKNAFCFLAYFEAASFVVSVAFVVHGVTYHFSRGVVYMATMFSRGVSAWT